MNNNKRNEDKVKENNSIFCRKVFLDKYILWKYNFNYIFIFFIFYFNSKIQKILSKLNQKNLKKFKKLKIK